jgi:hypothetical protein
LKTASFYSLSFLPDCLSLRPSANYRKPKDIAWWNFVWVLPPDGPAAAVETPEENGEAYGAKGQQFAASGGAAKEQIADAEEHRVN